MRLLADSQPADGYSGGALAAEPDYSPTPGADDANGGLDLGLLVVFLGILAVVSISNIWLRRRAEREKAAGTEGAGRDSQ
jgi:hypothetical protein